MSRVKVGFAMALAALFAAPGRAFAQDLIADSMRAGGWQNVRDLADPDTAGFLGT